ncbi:sugar ABC transporter ATP-binding protein [Anaerotalea alkaliphila]|uniref:Ribose/galactose/methyl galactoside import ATP-binding protein n=1 Tax=Anaerotalea alkaliphila TaxID=2662126 RepID=A0A7X5KLL1_9FIRM|nr:sugar ABC transporter ATP-binding protein [Anaerotalea alkaliphila]NDL66814.1 sugar ABC transporter ATP-binding protein [Anaerotalea alkaliphila]
MGQSEYLLEMLDITKEFPGVKALKGVTLQIRPHEIHALVGENGAGKSTISKCLMGIYTPTSGKIIFDGEERTNYTIKEAMAFGVSMIHQELSPVRDRSIMSNMFLGREPMTKYGTIDWKKMVEEAKKWLKQVELEVDPRTRMADLSVAQMQMVEIARAISTNAKLIIMDEPTSALTEREVEQLFKIMRKLRSEGTSMVYISHKLDEIYKITDRISVFRDGEYIGTEDSDKLPLDRMIQMMVGREVKDMFPKVQCKIGEPFLEVEDLSHSKFFKNVSFDVRRGEIFGIAGLVGAGRTEVIETIFGILGKSGGVVKLAGKEVNIRNSRDAIKSGMALLTEERRHNGIFPILDIRFNTTVANLQGYINKFGLIDKKKIKEDTDEYIRMIGVKTPSATQLIQYLSGGNQQKVLVARWLLTQPEIIFLDEPTRGIDVGAKSEIHKLIGKLASQGKCVVMISSELPEIMGMSDRIMVMREGEVTGILDNTTNVSQEMLMEYASGVRNDYQ